jgi:hypothetical protein
VLRSSAVPGIRSDLDCVRSPRCAIACCRPYLPRRAGCIDELLQYLVVKRGLASWLRPDFQVRHPPNACCIGVTKDEESASIWYQRTVLWRNFARGSQICLRVQGVCRTGGRGASASEMMLGISRKLNERGDPHESPFVPSCGDQRTGGWNRWSWGCAGGVDRARRSGIVANHQGVPAGAVAQWSTRSLIRGGPPSFAGHIAAATNGSLRLV